MGSLTYSEHRDRHASSAARHQRAETRRKLADALIALERCYLDFYAGLGYIPGHPNEQQRAAYAAWLRQDNVVAMTAEIARLETRLGQRE